MKEIQQNGDCLIAVGITSRGDRKEFKIISGVLKCYDENLISLDIPIGVKDIWCYKNKLTELILPEGVEEILCYNNFLTELKQYLAIII